MLLAGVVAGLLDIVFAWVFWAWKANVPGVRVLQSVAAGVLGGASFSGGSRTAALGLTLHFAITLAMSAAYFHAARFWPTLEQRPWLWGAVYGVGLYLWMRFAVVPLSAAMPPSKDAAWTVLSVAAHIALVGWPIAWLARLAARAPLAGR